MRRILAAILAAFAAIPRFVWDATKQTFTAVASAPFAALQALFGGGQEEDEENPQWAAEQAARQAAEAERRADGAADTRSAIGAVRRVASAVAKGQKVTEKMLEGCPAGFDRYVAALRPEECRILARSTTNALRRFLADSDEAPEGVRSPREIAAERKRAASPEAEQARRREAVMAAIRGAAAYAPRGYVLA